MFIHLLKLTTTPANTNSWFLSHIENVVYTFLFKFGFRLIALDLIQYGHVFKIDYVCIVSCLVH